MSGTVARLRVGIIVAGVLLFAVLAGFFFFARWKQRFLRRDLPARLGINIQQDSTGFTLSKSDHGKTLFTLHAARAVQLKDAGNAELHDVRIVLYGKGPSPRQDRISGDEFAYDPKTQIVTAKGSVLIDLQSLNTSESQGKAEQNIHLRTSGLVFDQKTGYATTTQLVDFTLPQARGTAVGADYDTQQGLVTLHSQVQFNTTLDGGPATLHATHAQLDRNNWQMYLTTAQLHTAKRDAQAEEATVWLRPDGSADRLLALGNVIMTDLDGTVLTSPHVTAVFDTESKVQKVHAEAGVTMHESPSDRQASTRDGQAREAWLDMDGEGKPASLRMAGDVRLTETAAHPQPITRNLRAGAVQVAFRRGIAETVHATQSPFFEQVEGTGAKQVSKQLQGDGMTGSLRGGKSLEHLHSDGHTQITQHSLATGATSISRGDHLDASFTPVAGSSESQIAQAVQQGNVRIDRTAPNAPAGKQASGEEHTIAHADRADFEASSDTVLLTGTPRIAESAPGKASLDIAAERITMHRDSGDALADGAVKASVVNQPGTEPDHVVADHAFLNHSEQTVTFTGKPRLWQQGNSVQAPTLVVTQQPRGLVATASPDGKQPVSAVVAEQESKTDAKDAKKKDQKPQQPVRITARKLVYSEADRRARFTTNVVLVDSDGTIRSDQTDVFLKPESFQNEAAAPTSSGPMMSGQIDHIVATGNIFLTQPLRQGTGQQLVYTADDGKFVLTGDSFRPPRIEDRQQGTVSGEALQFLSRDDRVDVIGGDRRTVTTTHLNK